MLNHRGDNYFWVIPSPLWACPAPRELYLRRQMELEHVLGCVSHPSNPVHTPVTLPAAPHGARSVISRLYQNIAKIHSQLKI